MSLARSARTAALFVRDSKHFDAWHAECRCPVPTKPASIRGFYRSSCAQGDPTKHASISSNGAFLTLTNENGDTSPGNYQGQTGIVAPGWQFVTGTLSRTAAESTGRTARSGRGAIRVVEEVGAAG